MGDGGGGLGGGGPDSNVIFHEGAGIGNMSDLTGALLASAQLLPFHSNKDKGLLGEG